MRLTRNLMAGLSLLALIVACGVGSTLVEETAEERASAMESGAGMAPMFGSIRCGRRTCRTTG